MKYLLLLLLPTFVWAELNDGSFDREIFYQILNETRASSDLTAVTDDDNLEYIAEAYADICKAKGNISHDYELTERFMNYVPLLLAKYDAIGEVLMITTEHDESDVLLAWLKSAGHNVVLMKPDALAVGVGISRQDDLIYVVAYMARREDG